MANILIIDDDKMIQEVLSQRVSSMGHTAVAADFLWEGIELAGRHPFDIVFLDVRLPDGNGLNGISTIRQGNASPEVIIITAVGDVEGAELAFRNGAWDYIQKPFTGRSIRKQISRALKYRVSKKRERDAVSLKRAEIVGSSPSMKICLDQTARSAAADSNVLITGETGTGKELFARSIHQNSSRDDKSFVVVDCTVLPENLVESILFGHVKGAYTGAGEAGRGLVSQAHGGTLFLDEVGELPMRAQKALLRVLQERVFRPVGGIHELKSDFRLVSATNRNLDEMAEKGAFRQDLLFRLRTFQIQLPPLRMRREDISELALHHVRGLCEKHGLKRKEMSSDFIRVLESHIWPGNVRELISTLEEAILLAPDTPVLYPRQLPPSVRVSHVQCSLTDQKEVRGDASGEAILPGLPEGLEGFPGLKEYRNNAIENAEKHYIARLLQVVDDDVARAVEISGMSRARLYALIKKYRIKNSS